MKNWFKKIFKKKESQVVEGVKEDKNGCPECVCFEEKRGLGTDCVEKDEKLEKALEDHCQDTMDQKCDFSRKK